MNSTSINAVAESINRIIKPYLQSIQQHLTNLDMFEQSFDNNFFSTQFFSVLQIIDVF